MIPFRVTIVGSGSAIPTLQRAATSQVVQYNGTTILLDCAEGTQIQLKKLKISIMRIDHVFISHLHGDHYFGLIGLINTLHLIGRTNPLTIFGPPELIDIINLQLKASDTKLRYTIHFNALQPDGKQLIFEDKNLRYYSFPVIHRIPTWGFLFEEKETERQIDPLFVAQQKLDIPTIKAIKSGSDYTDGDGNTVANNLITFPLDKRRSYAFCTDTSFDERLATYFTGVSMLYYEATFMHHLADTAAETFHSTSKQAAQMALIANAEKLLIGHFSSRYTDLQPILEESREVFPNTDLALDGSVFEIAV